MAPVNVRARFCGALLGIVCGLGPSTFVAATEMGHAEIAAGLADEIARSVLPARIQLPLALAESAFAGARTATLAELGYCGCGEKGSGRFRAVVFQNDGGQAQRLLSIPDSCQLPLSELAKPAASLVGQGQALVIADVEATFRASWELKVSLARVVIVRGGAGALAPAAFDEHADVVTFATAPLRFDVAGSPIYLHARPSFSRRSIGLGIAVTEKAVAKPGAEMFPAAALLDGKATVAAEIPLSTVNLLLRRLTGAKPLTVSLEGDSVEIRNVGVRVAGSGAKAAVTVSGTATPQSIQETLNWTLDLAGDPLEVRAVHAAARVQDCASLGTLAAVACDLGNGARVAGAEAFARALTSRYGGQSAATLASPIHTQLPVAGRSVQVSGDLLRLASGSKGIVVIGGLSAARSE